MEDYFTKEIETNISLRELKTMLEKGLINAVERNYGMGKGLTACSKSRVRLPGIQCLRAAP
jgi:hypothetical protein